MLRKTTSHRFGQLPKLPRIEETIMDTELTETFHAGSGGFGTTTPNTNGFGQRPGFGNTTTTSGGGLFGGGTATTGASGGFGGFGNSNNNTASGGSLFGSTAQKPAFGGGNTGGGIFGGGSSNVAGGFGSNQQTGAFGTPISSALGQNNVECQGTGSTPFTAHTEKEGTGSMTNHYQSISFMAPYKNFSFEVRLAVIYMERLHTNDK